MFSCSGFPKMLSKNPPFVDFFDNKQPKKESEPILTKQRMILFSWPKHNKKQRELLQSNKKVYLGYDENHKYLSTILRGFFWDYILNDSKRIPEKLPRDSIGIR